VRELRGAVEANEPGRFLDAVQTVDQLGVAEAAADEIAPLCHHAEPRVRMYAIMAHTVLGPRGPAEAQELIAVFNDPNEEVEVRSAAAPCLVLFREQASEAVPALSKALTDDNHPLHGSAMTAFFQLGWEVTGALPARRDGRPRLISWLHQGPPKPDATRQEMLEFLMSEADQSAWARHRTSTGDP
jgi:HEAT repeat protein